MEVGNAGALTCPCTAGRLELIRPSCGQPGVAGIKGYTSASRNASGDAIDKR